MLVTSAAACSGDDESGDSTSLTLLTPAAASSAGGQVLRSVIEGFTTETGIQVQVDTAGEDLPTVFETSVAAGKQADIVHINPVDKPLTWIDNSVVVPVESYVDEWGLRDRLTAGAIDEWTRADGKMQGFPFEGYQWPIWYNKTLLAKAGITDPPATVDQLLDAATKLRAAGIQPMAVGGNDWTGQKLFFQIIQSYLSADAAKEAFAKGGWCGNPSLMKGIELFTSLRDAKVFGDNAEGFTAQSMVADFFGKKAAMMPAGTWEFAQVPKEMVGDIALGGMPLPSGATFAKPTAYEGTSNGFWVSQNGAKKLDAVRKFVEYMYRPETVATFVKDASMIMALKADASTLPDDQPLLKAAQGELPTAVDYAVLPDRYVPGSLSQSVIRDAAVAFTAGKSATDICGTFDKTYKG
ncbi:ABC transporter substrate-binding protein [Phytohabitans flavus]|uniref:ABC transporter substrate-binding protein n=1 Tax=Phytohabitans flavus TaxID=1076124 RepID=A0A6F8XRN7_9ACTN|nr:ABC transporter substrate-binding protein [Phytohabitans flavus]